MKIPFVGAQLWKLGTIGAGILSLVLVVLLLASYQETKSITKERDNLVTKIEDPKTGYVARLTQANQNVTTLETAISTQKVKYDAAAKENARVLETTRTQLVTAQTETRKAQAEVKEFLARPPKGNTAAERMEDIDKRILEDLNHGS